MSKRFNNFVLLLTTLAIASVARGQPTTVETASGRIATEDQQPSEVSNDHQQQSVSKIDDQVATTQTVTDDSVSIPDVQNVEDLYNCCTTSLGDECTVKPISECGDNEVIFQLSETQEKEWIDRLNKKQSSTAAATEKVVPASATVASPPASSSSLSGDAHQHDDKTE